jgi:hypothetical protein
MKKRGGNDCTFLLPLLVQQCEGLKESVHPLPLPGKQLEGPDGGNLHKMLQPLVIVRSYVPCMPVVAWGINLT